MKNKYDKVRLEEIDLSELLETTQNNIGAVLYQIDMLKTIVNSSYAMLILDKAY